MELLIVVEMMIRMKVAIVVSRFIFTSSRIDSFLSFV